MLVRKLPSAEQKAIMNYRREADRRRGLYGKYLLHYAYHEVMGRTAFPLETECGKYGKPYIKGQDFCYNISHSENVIVCAAADYEVGIDTEAVSNITLDMKEIICRNGEDKNLPKEESAAIEYLCKLWTVKESYVKWLGTGFSMPFGSISADVTGERMTCTSQERTEDACKFQSIRIDDGYYVTVCMSSEESGEMRLERVSKEMLHEFCRKI